MPSDRCPKCGSGDKNKRHCVLCKKCLGEHFVSWCSSSEGSTQQYAQCDSDWHTQAEPARSAILDTMSDTYWSDIEREGERLEQAEPARIIGIDLANGPDRQVYYCAECGESETPCKHYDTGAKVAEPAGQPTSLLQYGFSSRVVEPVGTGTNHILIVSEAPGEGEDLHGTPFYGGSPAGGMLSRLLKRGGWPGWNYTDDLGWRDSPFRITNIVWQRPPSNYLEGAKYEAEAIETWRPLVEAEIERTRPKAIVTLGNVALKALTAFGGEGAGISNVRGYVLRSYTGHWLVPTFHPSYIVQGGSDDSGVFIFDVNKAASIAEKGWERRPVDYLTHPGLDEWDAFVRGYNPDRHVLAWDIETPESTKLDEEGVEEKDVSYDIIRISFSYEQDRAASVPWRPPYLDGIRNLLGSHGPKRTWNGRLFDVPRVRANGVDVGGRELDLMWLWHFLQPTLRRSLAFVTPFYSWSGEPWKHLNDSQPEWYSAADADATWQNGEGIERDLRSQGLWQRALDHVVETAEVLTKMSENGLPYDQAAADAFQKELEAKYEERHARLQELVPREICPSKQKQGYKKLPKDLTGLTLRTFKITYENATEAEQFAFDESRLTIPVLREEPVDPLTIIEVKRWCLVEPFNPNSSPQKGALIKLLGYKLGKNRKTKKESADDDALEKIIQKCRNNPSKKSQQHLEVFTLIRECVQLNKVLGTYVKGWRPGRDGRIHATPGFWGKMYRISWRRPNIAATVADKKEDFIAAGFRKCVRAGSGRVLVESDWKGMEAVLVGYFADDPDYVRLSRLGVHDYFCAHLLVDRRKIQTSDLPRLDWSDEDLKRCFKDLKKRFPEDRDDAKHTVHGISYGMTPPLMVQLYDMTMKQARTLQGRFFELFPKVRNWQKRVMMQAYEEANLQNPFGYRMWFWDVFRYDSRTYDKLRREGLNDHDARKRAYKVSEDAKSALSFLPRDTGAAMLKEVLLRLERQYQLMSKGYVLSSTHDSILTESTREEAEWVAEIVRDEMCRPVPELGGLWIGVDQAIGECWDKENMTELISRDSGVPTISATVSA